MFSDQTYDELDRLTDQALKQMHFAQVIERVTVIRGYTRVCSVSWQPVRYEQQLVLNIQDLAELAKQYRNVELAEALEGLVARMDQERER